MIEVRRALGPCHLVRAPVSGLRHLGVPRGGPADRLACMVAASLAGNLPEWWSLECAMVMPVLQCKVDLGCVYSGPPTELVIESESGSHSPVVPGSFVWPAGSILRGGTFQKGLRGYLAIRGGLNPPRQTIGSVAKLVAGDVLEATTGSLPTRYLADLPAWSNPAGMVLHVLPGSDLAHDLADRLKGPWRVGPASDRMGLRLEGAALSLPLKAGRLSEPVVPGTVQLPGGGLPIVLGVDGQTIGGYPRLAHVVDADMDLLGQLRPGDVFQFCLVSPEEACSLGQVRARAMRDLGVRISESRGW